LRLRGDIATGGLRKGKERNRGWREKKELQVLKWKLREEQELHIREKETQKE